MDCIFCKIIKGEIPSKKHYEDDKMIIFEDISPKAKLHYLAVPKHHYALIDEMNSQDKEDIGYILSKIAELKNTLGLSDGYRLIINQGESAGQTVHHLHIHIMGGQSLGWPDFRE
ncbi:MAG TPA: histidine triad nucleotide-binding protein [Clostridia bacterium]